MFKRKSIRLNHDLYQGQQAYSLTLCTANRKEIFKNDQLVNFFLSQLDELAEKHNFEIYTYCFMPDHLHLLLIGTSEVADVQKFIKLFKQKIGYWFKQKYGENLWQKSYFDHVLRQEEDLKEVARYILENPVRANLVDNYLDFPFSGSFVFEKVSFLVET